MPLLDMYDGLGIHWASSVPAFLSLACVPFPFLFYKYGESIRLKCKFAAEAARVLAQFRSTSTQEDDNERHVSDDAKSETVDDTGANSVTELEKDIKEGDTRR